MINNPTCGPRSFCPTIHGSAPASSAYSPTKSTPALTHPFISPGAASSTTTGSEPEQYPAFPHRRSDRLDPNLYESSYNALWPQHAPPLIVYHSDWLDVYLRDRMADWAARVPVNYPTWARAEPALRYGNEADVTDELKKDFLPRLRRALRAIIPNPKFYVYAEANLNLNPVDFMVDRCQHGYTLRHWDNVTAGANNPSVPDLLGFDLHGQDRNFPAYANRLPGEIKPSWKFGSGTELTRDYMKNWMPLLQIHYYMLQRNARFGFIVTDRELYCLCREETPIPAPPNALPNGTLCVSPAIPLRQCLAPNRAGPNAPAPMTPLNLFAALFPPNGRSQITAPLALFVLSVLASSDLWYLPRA